MNGEQHDLLVAAVDGLELFRCSPILMGNQLGAERSDMSMGDAEKLTGEDGKAEKAASGPAVRVTGSEARLSLREIGRALEERLMEVPGIDVHWVGVVGESGVDPTATLFWDDGLSDSELQVSVAAGFNEGMLVYIHAQADRYKPDQLRVLFRIKVLCGAAGACRAVLEAWQFFRSDAFTAMLKRSSN